MALDQLNGKAGFTNTTASDNDELVFAQKLGSEFSLFVHDCDVRWYVIGVKRVDVSGIGCVKVRQGL